MNSNEKLTDSNNRFTELNDAELDEITGGNEKKTGKKIKFKKSCPFCHQISSTFALRSDGWYCPVCGKKVGVYKGLAADQVKHPRG